MTSVPGPWSASWSFTTHSFVTSGQARTTSFEPLKSTIARVAEASLGLLSEEEGTKMNAPWNRLIRELELHAEAGAQAAGRWTYTADNWADITLEYTS